MEIIKTPEHFRSPMPFNYPAHQKGLLIEEYAYEYLTTNADNIDTDLVYLPILWTSYHCKHNYGKNTSELQKFVDTLPKDKTYFTIVQYDDGTLVDMPNCIVFSCCGNKGRGLEDIPIPVLCDRHNVKRNDEHEFLSSFIGRIGNKVRPAMFEKLQGKENFHITDSGDNTELFLDIMKKTLFSLCPRGYGITSFRMYESMELGCIPIYIVGDDDDYWIPFSDYIDWNQLAILIKESEIDKIPEIISNMSQKEIDSRLKYIKENYESHFTLKGALDNVKKILENKTV